MREKEQLRDHILIGKERHDIGRPNDWGYPVRGIRNKAFLYLVNFESDRWPAGNPETGYLNCDGSPTKSVILHQNRHQNNPKYWDLSFGKRPAEELYDLKNDPDCIHNLANDPKFQEEKNKLRDQLIAELRSQLDPRVMGNGSVFDEYPYSHDRHRDFYNRFMNGDILSSEAGWVNPDDFETDSFDR